jgi:phage terminase large subunit-like protein
VTKSNAWNKWEPDEKLRLLAALHYRRWNCGLDSCDGLEHGDWTWRHSRTEQRVPPGDDWRVWYLRGGRGSGKSRTGAETLSQWILDNEPGDWAIVGPTYGDARDVCVESESGMLACLGSAVVTWNRSIGELQIANGSRIYLDGGDDGAFRIQGKNLRGAWCDEIGLWRKGWRTAWQESLQFAVRLAPGRIVATGTPKSGHPLVKMLLDDPHTIVTRMKTTDNAANLHPHALAELIRMYSGTRLGRQELEAEFLEDVEGALWTREQIDACRVETAPILERVVVAVDPNASTSEASNAAGIVVVGRGEDGRGYVLADRTVAGGPRAWAKASVDAYHDFKADRIVAEKNNGGQMVEITIQTVDEKVPIKLVTASRGKRVRAEPIASLYEQEKIKHVRSYDGYIADLEALEEEMVSWTPEAESPDRMDALVWGFSEVMLGRRYGQATILNPVGQIQGVGRGYGGGKGWDPNIDRYLGGF